jgi:hypothetical protein
LAGFVVAQGIGPTAEEDRAGRLIPPAQFDPEKEELVDDGREVEIEEINFKMMRPLLMMLPVLAMISNLTNLKLMLPRLLLILSGLLLVYLWLWVLLCMLSKYKVSKDTLTIYKVRKAETSQGPWYGLRQLTLFGILPSLSADSVEAAPDNGSPICASTIYNAVTC